MVSNYGQSLNYELNFPLFTIQAFDTSLILYISERSFAVLGIWGQTLIIIIRKCETRTILPNGEPRN